MEDLTTRNESAQRKQGVISRVEGARSPSTSLPSFPQIHHVISEPACVVDGEVTRAVEAEGEERD